MVLVRRTQQAVWPWLTRSEEYGRAWKEWSYAMYQCNILGIDVTHRPKMDDVYVKSDKGLL